MEALESIEKETDLAWDGELMKWWDKLRKAVLEYKKSSLPRDMFDAYIDGVNERAKAALNTIGKRL